MRVQLRDCNPSRGAFQGSRGRGRYSNFSHGHRRRQSAQNESKKDKSVDASCGEPLTIEEATVEAVETVDAAAGPDSSPVEPAPMKALTFNLNGHISYISNYFLCFDWHCTTSGDARERVAARVNIKHCTSVSLYCSWLELNWRSWPQFCRLFLVIGFLLVWALLAMDVLTVSMDWR